MDTSKTVKRFSTVLLLLIITNIIVFSQSEVFLNAKPGGICSLSLFTTAPVNQREETLAYTSEGLSVHVLFEVRIFRESNKGLDRYRLVDQFEIDREGFFSPFLQTFVIRDPQTEKMFVSANEFFNELFLLRDYDLNFSEYPEADYQIRIRPIFQKIKYSPPLTILALFSFRPGMREEWIIANFSITERETVLKRGSN